MRRSRLRLGRTSAVAAAVALAIAPPSAAQPDLQAPPAAKAVDPAALIGAPDGAPISGDTLDQRTEELSSRLRCPVCQALSVADSPSLSALAMKEEVRELLAAGYTEQQVTEYFERAYGEFIRLEPKPEGFNLVVWLAPAAALGLGLGLVAMRLRKRSRAAAEVRVPTVEARTEPPGGEEELAAYLARVRDQVGSGP